MRLRARTAIRARVLVAISLFAIVAQSFGGSLLLSAGFSGASQSSSQNSAEQKPPAQKSEAASAAGSRLTIHVTAGEKNEPVDSASVYVKYIQEHKLRKDKRFEMNVKTNRDGIAHVPDPPKGKILVQIIAPGWKPFGKWYEVADLSQPIQVHLEKPPRWY